MPRGGRWICGWRQGALQQFLGKGPTANGITVLQFRRISPAPLRDEGSDTHPPQHRAIRPAERIAVAHGDRHLTRCSPWAALDHARIVERTVFRSFRIWGLCQVELYFYVR